MIDDLKQIFRKQFKKKKEIAQQFVHRWTFDLSQTPFNRKIAETNLPLKFTALKFDLYDRMIGPMKHLTIYI